MHPLGALETRGRVPRAAQHARLRLHPSELSVRTRASLKWKYSPTPSCKIGSLLVSGDQERKRNSFLEPLLIFFKVTVAQYPKEISLWKLSLSPICSEP